ncbi:protein unc-13 homolog isoform X1 [Ipomoea triloba]|uniref:protein unc-13 homolog isoform X1 n=1 Tax=Ipomoea triloba TaxID=35885 RepID=UPI00125D3DB2|nr:protein unc-13 homolog isoform X1 [Ipomoea triloba]
MEGASLMQQYRRDRRKLLEFLLSSGLVKEFRTPSGPTTSLTNVNLDALSIDYVLECIQSSGVIDISIATKKYREELHHPITMQSRFGDSYFLLSGAETTGSPPRRMPPPVTAHNYNNKYTSRGSDLSGSLSSYEYELKRATSESTRSVPRNQVHILKIGLPTLQTGLSDDDLRESAYEVFLACMVFSGRIELHLSDSRRKEKTSRFLAGLKNKRGKRNPISDSPDRQSELIDIFRSQMQISEAMDSLIRQHLASFATGKTLGQVDVPQIVLGLLNGMLKSDFQNEKSYIQWKNRQANILEELLSSADYVNNEKQSVETLVERIRNSEDWDTRMSASERNRVLLAIRNIALTLSSMPPKYGIQGENYYWSAGYQLNVRVYEKLLLGLFDILEDGQLIEEAAEILMLLKSTWSMLGITQKLHNVMYAWVLFQQFVGTEEAVLLDYLILEMRKVLSAEDEDQKEENYIESLLCFTTCDGCQTRSNLIQSTIFSISLWCDSKLQDYHLHFTKKPTLLKGVMSMALAVGPYSFVSRDKNQFTDFDASDRTVHRKVKDYVESSIEAACRRVTDAIGLGCKIDRMQPLALLASELKLIAEKELTQFYPILQQFSPEAGIASALKFHKTFGERLEPFLNGVTCLSEGVREVLTAAALLEDCLFQLYSLGQKESGLHSPSIKGFEYYKIGEVARPIILDWIIAQHARILEWTGRAFDLEDWEPLSYQQKQAASAVEVFRIIEETVDQLFEMRIPVDITHLQALLSIIFHTLDAYLQKLVNQLVDKSNLYPPAPPLTRYKETTFPIIKRKLTEAVVLDNGVNDKLSHLTASKLCVRLNTLQYIQRQIATLEDGIRKSWSTIKAFRDQICSEGNFPESSNGISDMSDESIDELFAATFDCIRDSATNAIRKTCDFLGARVVFWDLREPFVFHLYHNSVGGARLESILPQFDSILNNVCGLIDDGLRDLAVSSIYKSSLEGYIWVLLDGGPSRAFSNSDVPIMEEDLNMLKDLFVADGEGLLRSLVEKDSKITQQILSLFSLQANSVIRMLMTSSQHISVGHGAHKNGSRNVGDAQTLMRVLCHMKDTEASKFLKRHYNLPASSEYDDSTSEESGFNSPLMADLLKKSASLRWSDKGSSSFRSFKKKFHEATSAW